MPFAVAVCGFKSSGKSTLCYKLLKGLRSKGLRVAYVKRTQEEVLSPADTDSGDGVALGFETLLGGAMASDVRRRAPLSIFPS